MDKDFDLRGVYFRRSGVVSTVTDLSGPPETAGAADIGLARNMPRNGPLNLVWGILRFTRRKPLGALGALTLAALVIVALAAPLIVPIDPGEIFSKDKYASPGEVNSKGHRYLLGSDQLGRDTLSRLIYGSRIALRIGLISVAIGVTAGALIGVFSAYLGGKTDLVAQRVIDAMMAFPALVLALGIVGLLGPSETNVIITLIVLFVPGSSRVVRSEALRVKGSDYVDASRAVGCGDLRIIFRHLVPNCMAPYIVFATANLGLAIVVEASLSFLGVGASIDDPSWGGMLKDASGKYLEVSPWLIVFPSLAIAIVVFSVNLLGDALRDVLDPRLRQRT